MDIICEKEKIGIIIPAYNAHNTISKLLHSISLFTFLDKVEVCLVDDCSEKKYDYLYERFPDLKLNIIRLETNQGPGVARNIGIDWALKKEKTHLIFADSDDYFLSTNFWDLVEEKDKDSDYFLFKFYDQLNDMVIRDIDVWSFAKVYNIRNIKKYNLRFAETYANEDVVLNFMFFPLSKKVFQSNEVIYHWTNTENSLSRQKDYDIKSMPVLLQNLVKSFIKNENLFTNEKKAQILANRMLRFWHAINQLITTNPTLLKKEKPEYADIVNALRGFYKNCYEPYERFIDFKTVLNEYNISCTSGPPTFIWIDYYSFIEYLKIN